MAVLEVKCNLCQKTNVKKHGKHPNGTQRYKCYNEECTRNTFILSYQKRGKDPEVKRQIIDMAMNGSGIRDTSRVLKISRNTVTRELKKTEKYFKCQSYRYKQG